MSGTDISGNTSRPALTAQIIKMAMKLTQGLFKAYHAWTGFLPGFYTRFLKAISILSNLLCKKNGQK